jgi:AraC-like DNA-binding protein
MAVVMRALHAGCSLTDAAMSAGFASSAHLSSAFRRIFGLAPSEIVALGARIDLSEDVGPLSA